MRLRQALDDSLPLAFAQLQQMLGAISLLDVQRVLVALVRDIAGVWCGSVILGAGAGAVVGAFGFGVGAIPGAALGAEAGAAAGEALLALFGLKALADSMASAMPRALRVPTGRARATPGRICCSPMPPTNTTACASGRRPANCRRGTRPC